MKFRDEAPQGEPAVTETPVSEETRLKDELRRQLYERIAQGNALAEAEDYARCIWNNR